VYTFVNVEHCIVDLFHIEEKIREKLLNYQNMKKQHQPEICGFRCSQSRKSSRSTWATASHEYDAYTAPLV
jgi:hypothetical protein